jgi:hypothetical protein
MNLALTSMILRHSKVPENGVQLRESQNLVDQNMF